VVSTKLSSRPLKQATRHPQVRLQTEMIHAFNEASAVVDRVVLTIQGEGYSEQDTFAVRLAMEEALVNAIKHGNCDDPTKHVCVSYQLHAANPHPESKCVLIEIEDQGRGFHPDEVLDPTIPENLERPNGRGLMLMRRFMSWVRFNEQGNRVTMCKYCSLATEHGRR
jgi:serine/threonine-protein kinase RsbW